MPVRWTTKEETQKRKELEKLYVRQNKTIFEVGEILELDFRTVYDRLKRLKIPTCPERKSKFCNIRKDIKIPKRYSEKLAEFTGIMVGDGHISPTQLVVTVNKNETDYLEYLKELIKSLFNVEAHKIEKKNKGAIDIYIGSTELVRLFLQMGLAMNKVREQVDVPSWIKTKKIYAERFLRGFFDTDGSIYKLRFGIQISYKSASAPLLNSTRELLIGLGYRPSKITWQTLYLTRNRDLRRFFTEIRPTNKKHIDRALFFGVI